MRSVVLVLLLIANSNMVVATPENPSTMKELVDYATDGESNIGGCGFKLEIPESCQYQITPLEDSDKCTFSALGLPLLYKEMTSVASGQCEGSYGLTLMKTDKTTKDWSVGVLRDGTSIAGSGYISNVPLDKIIGGSLPKVGIDLNDIGFPEKLTGVSLGAAKIGTTTWIGFGGTNGPCKAEVLSKKASTATDSGAVVSATCENMKFLDFLGKFGGKNVKLSFLKGIGFTALVSTMNVNPADEIGEEFKNSDLEIATMDDLTKNSVAFSASIGKPNSCDDVFCKFLETVLQDDQPMVITGTVTKTDFTLSGSIPFDLKLSNNARMKDLVVEVNSAERSVALELNFEFQKPELLLTGSIGASTAGVELAASLAGTWNKAFGITHVAMGNVNLAASFIPPSPVPTAFELRGTLYFGKKPSTGQTDERLISTTYMGINTVDSTQNYFYSHLEATLGKVLGAFGLKNALPNFLKDTGFPDGVTVSFTTNPEGKSLPDFSIEIPTGLRLFGAFEILGFKASGDITIATDPIALDMEVTLPVIKLGNIVSFRASKDENSGGANGLIKFDSTNPMATKMAYAGYLDLFGEYRYGSLEVDSQNYKVATGGKLFSVFTSDMNVTASYGNIKTATFSVHVLIEEGVTKMSDDLRNALENKLQEGKDKISAARNKVKDEEDKCKKKMSSDCDKCKNKAGGVCGVAEKTCKAGCFGKKKCKKRCNRKKDNCKDVIAKGCGVSCKTFNAATTGLCNTMDVAKATLKTTESTYGSIVKVSLDGLNGPQIFMVNKITFDANLSTEELGTVSATIEFTVLKKNRTFKANINLKNVANRVGSEITNLLNGIYKDVKNIF